LTWVFLRTPTSETGHPEQKNKTRRGGGGGKKKKRGKPRKGGGLEEMKANQINCGGGRKEATVIKSTGKINHVSEREKRAARSKNNAEKGGEKKKPIGWVGSLPAKTTEKRWLHGKNGPDGQKKRGTLTV